MLRGENTSKVLKMRSVVTNAFREHLFSRGYFEVILTKSSQLYLETYILAVGDVFCMAQSYRAEKSRTRHHVAEYTHIETKCPFIDFPELLDRLEDLVTDVVDRVLKSSLGHLVYELNPKFEPPINQVRKRGLNIDKLSSCHYCRLVSCYIGPGGEHYELRGGQ